jgi:MFS family permease
MRGKLIGIGQAVTGLAAIGAGAWIQWVLSPQGPGYPTNYILIFGLASLGFGLSSFSNSFIVEPPEAVSETRPNLRDYLPQLAQLWQRDWAFRRVTLARLLAGLGGLATTFYVVYATDILRLPESSIGWFATAATMGGATAGLLLGGVATRWGSHRVIQITCWVEFVIPVFALACASGIFGRNLNFVFPVLYFLLGVFESSIMLGFLNFVLEIAPAGQRPSYMGLTNTLAGIMVVIPLVGGFILEYTSYTFLFLLAAAGTLTGALLALTLPNPQPVTEPASLPDSHITAAQLD